MLFINRRIYSDIESYKVLTLKDKVATVVPVKRVSDIDMKYIPGGFAGTCVNNSELFTPANSHIEECGNPFDMVCRTVKGKEIYGVWRYKSFLNQFVADEAEADAVIANLKEGYGAEKSCDDGHWWVTIYELTSKGKPRMTFEPYGELSDECHYYYDYNF